MVRGTCENYKNKTPKHSNRSSYANTNTHFETKSISTYKISTLSFKVVCIKFYGQLHSCNAQKWVCGVGVQPNASLHRL